MQLIEIDDAKGVRATVTTFASDASSLRFVLVPLAWLAAAEHFAAIRDVARGCDLVVIGSGSHSRRRERSAGRDVWKCYERIARGPHVRLETPPRSWAGVDRPFVKARRIDAGAGLHACHDRARTPLLVTAGSWIAPLVSGFAARYGTRVVIARVLAAQCGLALGPVPSGRGPLPGVNRFGETAHAPERAALADAVQWLHAERRGQRLRVAVVHWADAVPAVARALGALGYAPVATTWIPVFAWLPGETPADEPPDWFQRQLIAMAGVPA